MKQIEAGLEGYYSEASTLNSNGVNTMEVDVNRPEIVVHKTPFVKINLVSEGSPADYAVIYIKKIHITNITIMTTFIFPGN